MARWIERGRLAKLAEVWATGLDLDWRALHRGEPRRRLPLPGYPYAHQRCWVETRPVTLAAPAVATMIGYASNERHG